MVRVMKDGRKYSHFRHDRSPKFVCKRCKAVMNDVEEWAKGGEYNHPSDRDCNNDGKTFRADDNGHPVDRKEVELFLRKSERRRVKRA